MTIDIVVKGAKVQPEQREFSSIKGDPIVVSRDKEEQFVIALSSPEQERATNQLTKVLVLLNAHNPKSVEITTQHPSASFNPCWLFDDVTPQYSITLKRLTSYSLELYSMCTSCNNINTTSGCQWLCR
jgi:hypothetical protein